jgi:hypothetical protein
VNLLRDMNAATFKNIVERMRKQIDEYNGTHADLPLIISREVSIAKLGEFLDCQLKKADTLMYQEKSKET